MSNLNNLTKMSEQEKIIFLKVLSVLGKADANFDDGEKKFITDAAAFLGIPSEKIPTIFETNSQEDVIKEVSLIKNRSTALSLIREACFMANSDGDLSDQEIIFIGKIGEAMGIDLAKVEQISQWVIDYLVWQEQGKIIFEQA